MRNKKLWQAHQNILYVGIYIYMFVEETKSKAGTN